MILSFASIFYNAFKVPLIVAGAIGALWFLSLWLLSPRCCKGPH